MAAAPIARLAVYAAIAATCNGCVVGPNYRRPAVQTPPQYRFIEGAAQGESLADARWWQVFDDPVLQALIRESIGNNLDLRAAAARVEIARAQAGIAKSRLYPRIDGSASYTFQQNSNSGTSEDDHDDHDVQQSGIYGFELSWELDLFGKLRRQREAAVAQMLASEQGRRGVLVTLVGDVAVTYFRLRELDVELEIARRTLQLNDRSVKYFQDRLDGGVSNRLEVDRIKANRSQTAATIPDLERQIALAENSLSLLLGRTPGPIGRATNGAGSPPSIPPGLPASLLERRPDVLQAEQFLVAANANVGAAKALFFPAVNLTGFAGGISGDLTTLLGSKGGVWTAGSDLLQPIFNAGGLKRNLEAARAAVDEAVAQYQKAALNGYREVANALITIQKLGLVRIEIQAAVDALRDASDLARSRYDSGLATYLEILDADQQLFRQELLLAQTGGAELQARADLYRALGGGWQP